MSELFKDINVNGPSIDSDPMDQYKPKEEVATMELKKEHQAQFVEEKKEEPKTAKDAVVKNVSPVLKKEDTIFDLIEKSKSQMALAIPNAMSVDRLARVFVTEIRKNPKLMNCDKMSLMSALMQISQLGLEVGVVGQAYLVPYGKECQLIVGYKGLVAMALRSGNVKSINCQVVYDDDYETVTTASKRPTVKAYDTGSGNANDAENFAIMLINPETGEYFSGLNEARQYFNGKASAITSAGKKETPAERAERIARGK